MVSHCSRKRPRSRHGSASWSDAPAANGAAASPNAACVPVAARSGKARSRSPAPPGAAKAPAGPGAAAPPRPRPACPRARRRRRADALPFGGGRRRLLLPACRAGACRARHVLPRGRRMPVAARLPLPCPRTLLPDGALDVAHAGKERESQRQRKRGCNRRARAACARAARRFSHGLQQLRARCGQNAQECAQREHAQARPVQEKRRQAELLRHFAEEGPEQGGEAQGSRHQRQRGGRCGVLDDCGKKEQRRHGKGNGQPERRVHEPPSSAAAVPATTSTARVPPARSAGAWRFRRALPAWRAAPSQHAQAEPEQHEGKREAHGERGLVHGQRVEDGHLVAHCVAGGGELPQQGHLQRRDGRSGHAVPWGRQRLERACANDKPRRACHGGVHAYGQSAVARKRHAPEQREQGAPHARAAPAGRASATLAGAAGSGVAQPSRATPRAASPAAGKMARFAV